MTLSIDGKQITPNQWEVTVYGWHGVVERISSSSKWRAWIAPLTEPLAQSRIVAAPQHFKLLTEGKGWCITEIWRQWSAIFRDWRLQPTTEAVELHDSLIARFVLYNAKTVYRLVNQTLHYWGARLVALRKDSNELREAELTAYEPAIMLERSFYFFQPDWLATTPRLPGGKINLEPSKIESEGQKLATDLAKLPFYQTINVFCQVVLEWLQTYDLTDSMEETQVQQNVMLDWIGGFELD